MSQIQSYRLPSNISPLSYNLSLSPCLDSFTFKGNVSIHLKVLEKTQSVVINSSLLQITSSVIKLGDGSSISPIETLINETEETVSFIFAEALPEGNALLSIHFSGILNDQLKGFYRCEYLDENGETRHLATTQFEPTSARMAFPCWDEPSSKATFHVTLTIPSNLTAISNTNVEKEVPLQGGLKSVRFAKTPVMSTYLLAFVVGDLSSIEDKAYDGTTIRVWATRGKETQGSFALKTATKLLEFFNNYFGIPYPLDKLDHIAIPDFAAGAMENWGAITYRETALLFDPNNSSKNTQQRIAEIIAHEMAHMWFGDLVTMDWWDSLWLNESFASWMGNKAVDFLYPEWDMWTQFVAQDNAAGLSLDGLKNSHPVEMQVENPAEIEELFDAISYSKGASVLRMLEDYLGEKPFQKGIYTYLQKHAYGNACTNDLWEGLETATGKPVTAIMESWIKQPGYPLIEVTFDRDKKETLAHFSQSRFLYENILSPTANDDALWQVPISIKLSDSDNKVALLLKNSRLSYSLNLPKLDGWAKVNSGHTGFYRVNYSPVDWEYLKNAVISKELSANDRLGLQNDAYALMKAGHVSPSLFLSLIQAYSNEADSSVWAALLGNLRGFESLIISQPYFPQFLTFAKTLLSPIAAHLSWNPTTGEGHLPSLLRPSILRQIGSYGDVNTLDTANKMFEEYILSPSSINPDLRSAVFELVAQSGSFNSYKTLHNLAIQSQGQEEKLRLLFSLASFNDQSLLTKTLNIAMGPEVRSQDTVSLISAVAGNRIGRKLAWDFIKNNWIELNRRYGAGGFLIMRLASITGFFNSTDLATDVEVFFKENPAPSANRTIQQSLERIRLNTQWIHLNQQCLTEWFNSNVEIDA